MYVVYCSLLSISEEIFIGVVGSRHVVLLDEFNWSTEIYINHRLAGYSGPGYYFWDESQTHYIGPFNTVLVAEKQAERYFKRFLQKH